MSERADDATSDEAAIDMALATRIDRTHRAVPADSAAAEAELFLRLQPRVRAWASRYVRESAEAADLVQHVMLVILEALRAGRVKETERIGAFIHGTCKNTLMSWRRGERRRQTILETFGPTLAAVVDVAMVDEVALDRERLAQCFQHLASRAQSILTLTFFADRSSDEIAAELAISTSNVRVLKHRAIHELHDCVMRGRIAL